MGVAFENASWPAVADTRCTALPEYDNRRQKNAHFTRSPRNRITSSPKSTSASSPGWWVWETNT